MNELLKSNIKKSFKVLAEEVPKIPEGLIEVVEEEPSQPGIPCIVEGIAKYASGPSPWFYRDQSNELQSPQQSFFAIYSVRNTVRGILLGLRFLQAANLLKENGFLSASVFSYYTASFHLLNSFLALNGRVLIEPVQGPPRVVKRKGCSRCESRSLDPTPDIVIAILTRNNIWKFEPRRRSHAARWKELNHVFAGDGSAIPDFFLNFFRYIMSYGGDFLSSEETLVQDAIKRLTDIRHTAIYEGYGYDDCAHDALMNRDLSFASGIDNKSNAYRDFAVGLLTLSVGEFIELKNSIPEEHWNSNKAKSLLICGILTPPFEYGPPQLTGMPELSETLEWIFCWLLGINKNGSKEFPFPIK